MFLLALCAGVGLLCLPLLAHSDVLIFKAPIKWGFINWAMRYPSLQTHFNEELLAGVAYPRWLTGLMGGHGYPTFIYYPPGAFFAATPLTLLTGNVVLGWKLTLMVFLFAGSFGTYRLCRLFIPKFHASLTALIFLYLPYTTISLYARASYSELLAMMLVPWCLYYLIKLARKIQTASAITPAALKLSLCTTALCYTHPFIAIHFTTLAAPYAALLCWQSRERKILLVTFAICAALALTLSSPYWLNLLFLRDAINSKGIFFSYPQWWPPLSALLNANMGLSLFALLGFYLHPKRSHAILFVIVWAWFTFLRSNLALEVWRALPWLTITQLPYRILTVESLIRLLGLVFFWQWLIGRYAGDTKRLYSFTALTLLLIAGGIIYKPVYIPSAYQQTAFTDFWHQLRPQSFSAYMKRSAKHYNHESLGNDFLPKTVRMKGLKNQPVDKPLFSVMSPNHRFVEINHTRISPNASLYANILIRPRAFEHNKMVRIRIRQLDFPGWKIRLTPVNRPDQNLPKKDRWYAGTAFLGYQEVRIYKTGNYELYVDFTGAPHADIRNNLVLLVACCLLLLLTSINRQLAARHNRFTDDFNTR